MNRAEIIEMNALMKSLETDVEEMAAFNQKLNSIISKKEMLAAFYDEKWMEYYDNEEEFASDHLEILNQDSLWNVIADCDSEARKVIKKAAEII